MTTIPPQSGDLRGAVDLSHLVNRATTQGKQAAPSGSSISVPALINEGTQTNFPQFLELSQHVPVLIDLWAEWCEPCKQLTPLLEKLVHEYNGRFVLVKVDVDANPQIAQAFQVQSIPAIAVLIAGKPLQLFAGVLPEQQLRDVFEQVLRISGENGVSQTATVENTEKTTPENHEQENPLHTRATDAAQRGDFVAAHEAYKEALAQNPHDEVAISGLARVNLLQRLNGKTADSIRSRASENPHNIIAQCDIADLDISGGHIDDAFDRLLSLYPSSTPEEQKTLREHLVELFDVVGSTDPRVSKARKRLTSLLY